MLRSCRTCNKSSDGPMRDGYCSDCWPGWNTCANDACRHYRCDHNVHLEARNYTNMGLDPATAPYHNTGCDEACCSCEAFQEPDELAN
jgi:hypothetical protein